MSVHTIVLGMHVAAVDMLTGAGLLAMPDPSLDVADPIASPAWGGVHEADLQAALAALDRLGIEPAEPEDDMDTLSWEGALSDGRPVVGLYVREPVASEPSTEEGVEAFAACRAALEAHFALNVSADRPL